MSRQRSRPAFWRSFDDCSFLADSLTRIILMTDELSNIIRGVLALNELNTLLD